MAEDKISLELKLDHFKVYKQHSWADQKPRKVSLRGQFERAARPAEIDNMLYFANPTRKNGSTLIDRNAHLAFYELRDADETRRIVVVRNQFGLQRLLLGRAYFLLAPSEKVERGSSFPERLDHFKAYYILRAEPLQRRVRLVDQLDREYAGVAERPVLFCVPVTKRHGERTFKVQNPRAHLTFYSVTPRPYKVKKKSRDQFGRHELVLGYCVYLGVPTIKLDWQRTK